MRRNGYYSIWGDSEATLLNEVLAEHFDGPSYLNWNGTTQVVFRACDQDCWIGEL